MGGGLSWSCLCLLMVRYSKRLLATQRSARTNNGAALPFVNSTVWIGATLLMSSVVKVTTTKGGGFVPLSQLMSMLSIHGNEHLDTADPVVPIVKRLEKPAQRDSILPQPKVKITPTLHYFFNRVNGASGAEPNKFLESSVQCPRQVYDALGCRVQTDGAKVSDKLAATRFDKPMKDMEPRRQMQLVQSSIIPVKAVLRAFVGVNEVDHLPQVLADKEADKTASLNSIQTFRCLRDEPIVTDAVSTYNEATERGDVDGQVQALSVLAHQFTLAQLQQLPFVKKINKHNLGAAISHANVHGVGQTKRPERITRCRYNVGKVKEALQHIHSPTFLQQVAFGEKSIKFSDGTVMKVPALQRKQLREHMWKSYSDLVGDTGISRSEHSEAVNISTATQQKSLAALDNISVRYGTENFKSMCSIINALAEKATGLGQLAAQLRAKIQRLEAHLKSSLQDHLQPTSTCAAHCITCLLGGQNEFSGECGATP